MSRQPDYVGGLSARSGSDQLPCRGAFATQSRRMSSTRSRLLLILVCFAFVVLVACGGAVRLRDPIAGQLGRRSNVGANLLSNRYHSTNSNASSRPHPHADSRSSSHPFADPRTRH